MGLCEGHSDIQRLEDNHEGELFVNVYFINYELQSQSILIYRTNTVRNATYDCYVLNREEGYQ